MIDKYFEVNALNEVFERRRNEFKARNEHLQKRKEALYERELMFKERVMGLEKKILVIFNFYKILYLVMKCILK